MLIKRNMLGLSVTEQSMIVVEVGSVNGGCRALRAAKFLYPEESGLHEPEELGKALKQFLRKEGFSTRRCVVGMEAKWLTAREKTLPPGSADSLEGILSIIAEREFASDYKDLVFDYIGPDGSDQGERVFLVAASRKHVEQLQAIAKEAGLNVIATTSSTIALACSSARSDVHQRLVLHLMPGGAELLVQSQGSLRMLQRFSLSVPADYLTDATGGWLDNLVSELRRVMSLLPSDQTAGQERELHMWNTAGLGQESLDFLAERIAPQAKLSKSPADVDMAGLASDLQKDDVAVAACLGAVSLHSSLPSVDFLHSRMSPPKKATLGRRIVNIAVGLVVIIAICAFLFLDWRKMRREVRMLEDRLERIAPSISEARDIIDKTTLVRGWYDREPRYLECLRELTLAFPAEGRIWTTSLSIQEDMQVIFSGKAVNKVAVLEVLDRLKDNPRFSQIKPLYLRESGKEQRKITFAISLNYVGSGRT